MVVYTQQFYGSRVVIPTQQVAPEMNITAIWMKNEQMQR